MQQHQQQKKCALPRCNRNCYPGYDYCGKSHAVEHQRSLQHQFPTTTTLSSNHIGHSVPNSNVNLPVQRVFPKDVVVMNKSDNITQPEIEQLKKECSRFGIILLYCPELSKEVSKRLLYDIQEYGSPTQAHGNNSQKISPDDILFDIKKRFRSTVQEIHFYNINECFYEFTNFYERSIFLNKCKWPTSEHYFQAQKFQAYQQQEQVRNLPTPREAFNYSRSNSVRSDWNNIKTKVMFDAVFAKFSQHEDLKELLLLTGNARLVEHTKNDSFWGDGGDGTGENMLGKILVDVREKLFSSCLKKCVVEHIESQKFLTALDNGTVSLSPKASVATQEWIWHERGFVESVQHPNFALGFSPKGDLILTRLNKNNDSQRWDEVSSNLRNLCTGYVVTVDKENILMDYPKHTKDQTWKVTKV